MSYYQFQGPVQGGFGPLDDEMRRRRKHHRDAGAPFSGGITTPSAGPAKFQKVPEYNVQVADPAPPDHQGAQGGAPRMAAAVDMGQGPVQQPHRRYNPINQPIDPHNIAYTPDDVAVGSGGLSKMPGYGERPYDPHEIVWRRQPSPEPFDAPGPPERPDGGEVDVHPPVGIPPTLKPDFGPMGPHGPPAGRPTPKVPRMPQIQVATPIAIPKPVQPVRDDMFADQTGLARPVRHAPVPGPAAARRPTTKRRIGGRGRQPGGFGPMPPQPPKRDPDGGVPYSGTGPKVKKPRRGVRWGKDQTKTYSGSRHTPGRIQDWVPGERERHQGYRQLGQHQGREMARREHLVVLDKMRKQNRNMISALRKRGGEQLDARDRLIRQQTQAGGELVQKLSAKERLIRQQTQAGGALVQQLGAKERIIRDQTRRGGALAQRVGAQDRIIRDQTRRGGALVQQLGAKERTIRDQTRRGGALVQQLGAKETRIGQLLQEGRSLDASSKKQIRGLQEGMGREGLRADRSQEQHKLSKMRHKADLFLKDQDYDDLKLEANRRIHILEKKLSDGSLGRSAAQKEIDALNKQLAAARRKPEAKQDKDGLKDLRDDIAGLKASLKSMPRGGGGGGGAPIVVQGGSGGGASSSAGGSSASSGGGGSGAAAPAAPDLSKLVEAVKQIAGAAKKKGGGGTKGITQARRTYTDKRKAKIAELRALKSKRIREFATKTKKLPKADRLKQRREYKKRVEAQFKEMQTRFPTARGLKSVGVLRELIRKIDAFKSAK
jgi:hypothetical protein